MQLVRAGRALGVIGRPLRGPGYRARAPERDAKRPGVPREITDSRR